MQHWMLIEHCQGLAVTPAPCDPSALYHWLGTTQTARLTVPDVETKDLPGPALLLMYNKSVLG